MRYTLVMTRVKIEYMLFAAMSLVAGAAYGRGPVVAAVGSGPWANPDLYVGEWYEIARFDHPFQEGRSDPGWFTDYCRKVKCESSIGARTAERAGTGFRVQKVGCLPITNACGFRLVGFFIATIRCRHAIPLPSGSGSS